MTVQQYLEFKSRVDTWALALILGSVVISLVGYLGAMLDTTSGPATRFAISIGFLPLLSFLIWVLAGTRYRLTETELHTQSGPFRKKINFDSITMVEPVCNYQTGLALSRDRFRVRYNRFDTVEISPEDRGRFLQELAARAPHLIWQDEKLVTFS